MSLPNQPTGKPVGYDQTSPYRQRKTPAQSPTYDAPAIQQALQQPAPQAGPAGGYGAVPGFDTTRLNNPQDNDPKTVFGRFASSKGGHVTAADILGFAQADPRWETSGSPNDPLLRVKQAELDKWKPGKSLWQDVIRDAGGMNAAQFLNAPGQEAPATGGVAPVNPMGSLMALPPSVLQQLLQQLLQQS